MKNIILSTLLLLVMSISSYAQSKVNVDLIDLQKHHKLTVRNRDISVASKGEKTFLKMGTRDTVEGIIWLPVKDFKKGKLVMVARGKDILQGSFAGIAFHGINDSTHDNVYCRPFNFRASDSVRKIHAVQYVFAPNYHWHRLRTEHNGVYEKGIAKPPKADDWFTLTLVVDEENVKAYINHEPTPSLTVKKLNTNKTGKVGLTGINCDILGFNIDYQDN